MLQNLCNFGVTANLPNTENMDTNTTPVLTDTLDKGVLDMLDERMVLLDAYSTWEMSTPLVCLLGTRMCLTCRTKEGATRRLFYIEDVYAAAVLDIASGLTQLLINSNY